MMKKAWNLFVWLLVLTSVGNPAAFAANDREISPLGIASLYDVVAPVTYGDISSTQRQVGQIFYDTSASAFKGVNNAGNIDTISGPTVGNPSGTILAFAGTSAPTGYLTCDGSAVSRTTYAALYAAIGVAFGSGDGSTTFNIPDFRGRFLRGVDGGASRDPDAASRTAMNSGGNTGNSVGSVQAEEFKSHTHSFSGIINRGTSGGGFGALTGAYSNDGIFNSPGSSGGNETRPINAYVNYIIKY